MTDHFKKAEGMIKWAEDLADRKAADRLTQEAQVHATLAQVQATRDLAGWDSDRLEGGSLADIHAALAARGLPMPSIRELYSRVPGYEKVGESGPELAPLRSTGELENLLDRIEAWVDGITPHHGGPGQVTPGRRATLLDIIGRGK